MRRTIRLAGASAIVAAALLAAPAAHAATTPIAGFEEKTVTTGVSEAVGMDFAPDGRIFVAEKSGRVKAVNPGGAVTQVVDISAHVNSNIDRGLLGIAVDSAFAQNGYVYLLYVYEPTGLNRTGPKTSRLTRIQVKPDNTVANPSSPETVIVGKYQPDALNEACPAAANTSDCIPADGLSHVIGTVRSAPDGTLFFGTGDANHAATNSPDPFRTFDEKSFAGKIAHVDRNGKGLSAHSFCPGTTDLTQVCTKVFASGFRNPFRFEVRPGGTSLFAGDVGESTQEELDLVSSGSSYGWPCYEGNTRFPDESSSPTCGSHYSREGTPQGDKKPVYAYTREATGAAVIGGPEYQGSAYPSTWKGTFFWGDYVRGNIDRMKVDANQAFVSNTRFATGWSGTDLRVGPDGYLYSVNWDNITRFVPNAGNRSPVANATANPTAGTAPLTVNFDASASTDPDGDALTYSWSFGDGSAAGSGAKPAHTYSANGKYTARVTVSDGKGGSDFKDITITVGNNPPVLTVNAPTDGGTYRDGTPVSLSASATDPQDGTLPDSAIKWTVVLQHNTHQHSFEPITGKTGSFTPLRDHDTDAYYLVDVEAKDSTGLTTTKRIRLNPETAPISIVSDPSGADLKVSYGGVDRQVPYSTRSAIGYQTTVIAPVTIKSPSDGSTLVFRRWRDIDQPDRTRQVTVPAGGLNMVAWYVKDNEAPQTTITAGPTAVTTERQPRFDFKANEPVTKFECQMDANVWFGCWSGYRPPYSLQNGNHTFRVRAYDLGGNVDPTPAESAFTVQGAF